MALRVRSPAFSDGSEIPRRFTADGDNLSPPLEWSGIPDGTRSLVVVMEDPDAPSGIFRHWALYDVAPTRAQLPEGVSAAGPGRGVNDFGHAGYDGPAPPKGHGLHHYHFHVVALDVDQLPVNPSPKVAEVWKAARPHILAQAECVGTYQRR
ncbi:MAG: YbhB/YbcL family Raf kinase inhibitor-like protein [Magnetospirillum sp.]|nr:YbhB/YbcL family Raf kinase inhibitor-like protein [Magnetospirillum sp.]